MTYNKPYDSQAKKFFLERLGLSFRRTCVTIRAMTKYIAYENSFEAVVFVFWTGEMMKYVVSVVTELNGIYLGKEDAFPLKKKISHLSTTVDQFD